MATNWRINVLCLIGATIGLFSLLMPWQVSSGVFEGWIFSEGFVYFPSIDLGNPLTLIPGLFIIGTLLSFVTPTGCIFQGVWLISMSIFDFYSHSSGPFENFMGLGVVLGWASFLVIILSFFVPIGPGFTKKIGLKDRILVIGKSARQKGTSIEDASNGDSLSSRIWANLSHHRRATFALIISALILSAAIGIAISYVSCSQLRIDVYDRMYHEESGPSHFFEIDVYLDGELVGSGNATNLTNNVIPFEKAFDEIFSVTPVEHTVQVNYVAKYNPNESRSESRDITLAPFSSRMALFGIYFI